MYPERPQAQIPSCSAAPCRGSGQGLTPVVRTGYTVVSSMRCIIAHILTVVKFQTSAAECVPQTLPSPSAPGEGRVVIPRNLRHDAPSALRGEHHSAALWGATTRRAVLPQQVARSPVKARACSAEHASLRSKAAPSRGNQFPLDMRLRRDTPSALRGDLVPAVP